MWSYARWWINNSAPRIFFQFNSSTTTSAYCAYIESAFPIPLPPNSTPLINISYLENVSMSGKVAESVSKLESAVNDKNQDQNKVTAAFDEVSKLLKNPDDIKEFNKAISDNNNDIKALKGLSLVKIDDNGMEFTSANGPVQFNSKSNFKTDSEKETEPTKPKNLEFKIDENSGKSSYSINKGDTIWGVAQRICAERNPDKPTSALDVYREMNSIIKENPQLRNPDRIKEGRDSLTLPKDTVEAILAARKAKEEKNAETKTPPPADGKTPPPADNQTPPPPTDGKTPPPADNQTPPPPTDGKTPPPADNQTPPAPTNCEEQVGPDQRTQFLIQEQGWLNSKGQKKDTVFDEVDADGDGFLTTVEINKYRVENTIDKNKNHDAYLSELAQKRTEIEAVNSDETRFWFENDGITKKDLSGWTDSQTLADKQAKQVEQKKLEQEKAKAEEVKANDDAKVLLQDQKFFLKASGYDGTISIPDVDKYQKELANKQPANDAEKQQIEREKKALAQIRSELLRRSTGRFRRHTDEYVNDENGVMTKEDSQTWKV